MNYTRFYGLVFFGLGVASGACPNAEVTVFGYHPSLGMQTILCGLLVGLGAALLSRREALS